MGSELPQEGDGVGKIRENKRFMVLRGLFHSLPMKNMGKPNLVNSMVFLSALKL